MAEFEPCLAFVLGNEAGNPPNYETTPDSPPGAKVIAGINSYAYPRDFAFINSLPLDQRPVQVAAFYQRNFWNQYIAQLASQTLAAMVMDSMVNQGPVTGVKVLQTACNTDSDGLPMLVEDGIWGPETVNRSNALGNSLIPAFVQARMAKYQATPADAATKAAWIARARKIPS